MRFDAAELTMSGRAATNPSISASNSEKVTFRAVSTERRYDETAGDWIDGDEFGITVTCWRQIGIAVLQLVRKGDPVVVVGKLSTRKYEKDGVPEYFTECKADHVAIDVTRAGGRIRRQEASAAVDSASVKPTAEPTAGGGAGHRHPGEPLASTVDEPQRELAGVG